MYDTALVKDLIAAALKKWRWPLTKAQTHVVGTKSEFGKKPRTESHKKLATDVLDPEQVVVMKQHWKDNEVVKGSAFGPKNIGSLPPRDLDTNWDKVDAKPK